MNRNVLLSCLVALASLAGCGGGGDDGGGGGVTQTLTVTKTGAGSGTVTGTGIACGTDCSETYADGTVVTLAASPATGSVFQGWSGGGCSGTGGCTVTMSGAASVNAQFGLAGGTTHTLTVTRTGAGSGTVTGTGISCGLDCSEPYAAGTVVTLAASPATGSVFQGWSGGGCTGTGGCTVTMDAAASVSAQFDLAPTATFTLTVSITSAGGTTLVTSSPAGISCTGATCSATFASGTPVSLTAASPSSDAVFTAWGGDCTGGDPAACSVTMTADRSVSATFALPIHALDVAKSGTGTGSVASAPAGVSCGADCTESFTEGTWVTLTATADVGSAFTGWTGACLSAGTSPTCTLYVGSPLSVGAGFTLQRALDVTLAGSGSGRVVSDPAGIDCWSATCTASFPDGAVVTLTPTAQGGAEFAGWTGDCTGTGPCAVTMSAARAVVATFTARHTLTVTAYGSGRVTSGDGLIDCTGAGGACSATWLDGTTVSLTASPDAGWAVGSWSEAACSGVTCALTLTSSTSVNVSFTGPFDFTVATPFHTAFPFPILAGESRSFDVTLATTTGSGLPVTLSATGLPAGVTASFSPPVVTPPGSSSLTLTAAAGTAPGATPFTVTGVNGTTTNETQATVEVRSTKGLAGEPYGLAIEAGGATALVTESSVSWGVGRVVRVDLATRLATTIVAAGFPNPAGAPDLGPARDLVIESGGATALVVDANGLARVTLATGAAARIPTTPALYNPYGLALIDATTALVTDCGEASCANGRLVRVDLSAGTATRLTPAVSGIGAPRGVALEPGGLTALLVERNTPGRLLRVTLASGATTTIASGLGNATGLTLEPGGATVLVSRAGGEVTRVALATGLRSPMMNAYSTEAPGLAVESGGATALVVQGGPSRLLRLRLTSPIAQAAPAPGSFDTLFRPSGIALTGATTALVTDCGAGFCSETGRLVEVDLPTGSVVRTVVGGLSNPRSISVEAGGTTALVALNGTTQVVRVDLGGGSVTGTFNVTGVNTLWGVAADGAVAYATGMSSTFPSGAVLARLDLASTAVTLVGGQLGAGCTGRGVALEAGAPATTALVVRQCSEGPAQVSDLLRVPLDGSPVTVIASGFPPLEGVAIEAGGLSAIVTEGADPSEAGRVYRIELATGLTWELAAPLAVPRDLVVTASGDAVVAASDGLWGAIGAPAFAPRVVVGGFDRVTGFALEPGEATAVVATCPGPGTSDCTALGRLERVTLGTGARTAIVTNLDSPVGVTLEAPNTVLVTDCGPLPVSCTTKGRVVRFTGSTPTVIASGLNAPAMMTMEDGTHALLAEEGGGRILRLDLAARSYQPLVAGLYGPVQVIPEPGGATAIFAQTGPNPGLYRAELATGAVTLIAGLPEVGSTSVDARIALEPGGASALVLGAQWPSTRRSLFRVDLATGAVDLLLPGILGAPQEAWVGATSGLWWTERPVAWSYYRGAILNVAVP